MNPSKTAFAILGEDGEQTPVGAVNSTGRPATNPAHSQAVRPSHDTMTVGDLKAFLEDFPDELPVYYGHGSGDHWRTQIAGSMKGGELSSVKHSDYHQQMTLDTDAEEPDDIRIVGPNQALVLSGSSTHF